MLPLNPQVLSDRHKAAEETDSYAQQERNRCQCAEHRMHREEIHQIAQKIKFLHNIYDQAAIHDI